MFKNLTFEKLIKTILAAGGILLVGMILYNFSNLVAYALIALVFSYLLDPVVNRLQVAGLHRTLAISLVLATLFVTVLWISTSVIPIVANRIAILTRQLQTENLILIASQIEAHLHANFDFIPEGYLRDNISVLVDELFNFGRLSDILGNLIGVFTNLFAAFLVIPFAMFFFLKDGHKIRRDLLQLVPNAYFETTLTLIDKVETRLGKYFRSVLLQCSLVGVVSWIALSIAGLSNSGTVGVTIGIANTIPYFGPIMGYLLSIVIAIIETGDFTLVVPCILAVLFAQILDNVLFQPMIFSKSADIHPVAVLFTIMIGAQIAGILGMLVAIPIATILKITINQISWSLNNYHIFRASRNIKQSD